MGGRLVLLSVTHRVAPGLLSWPAWEALRSAARVVARDEAHPLAPALAEAGVAVEPLGPLSDAELARLLVAAAEGGVVLLPGDDGDPGLGAALADELGRLADRGGELPSLELVPGSWDVPGSRLLDLVAVMDRLRSPGGCPWDAQQTHDSLVPYLVEETFETVEAIETGDLVGLREELGDLLLQVVFHARLGEEHPEQPWSVDDVAAGIVEKLVRRHPHVFGGPEHAGKTAEQVEADWEVLKAAEKSARTSALDGVPMGLPALALAAKLVGRAGKAGVDVPLPELPPELAEVAADPEVLGGLLLGLVVAARSAGVDAEAALRAALRTYATAVRSAEQSP